jgi:serine protease
VERSTDGSTFSTLTTLGANTTNYTDTGLSGSTPYWYRVFASNASGGSAPSNIDSGTTLAGSAITLDAVGYKVKGKQRVDLTWDGLAGTNMDIYRDSVGITTQNDGAHTDNIGAKGGGSYVYMVCETESSNCSDPVTVVF